MRFCLASGVAFGAMAVFGKLAYDEGATVGTLLAVRFTLAGGLFWVGRRRRAVPRRARRARRARARRARLRAPGRLLLRRAGAHRRVAALAARLHVPGDRGARRGASGSTRRRRARARAVARRARARRRRRERARSTRSASRSGSAPRVLYSRLHPRQRRDRRGACRRRRSRRSSAPARRSRCCSATIALGQFRPRRARPPPAGAGSPASRRSRPSARSACSSPASSASGRRPRRSSPPSSRSSTVALAFLVFGETLGPDPARGRRARAWPRSAMIRA